MVETSTECNQKGSNSASINQIPAWNYEFNTKELLKNKRGTAPLFAALLDRSKKLGQSIEELCTVLGFSYPYYNQVKSGRRLLTASSYAFTSACAKYLGVSRLTVLVLANLIQESDLREELQDIVGELPRAIDYIIQDPLWIGLANKHVKETAPNLQYLIVRLYEKATGVSLIPKRLDTNQEALILQQISNTVSYAIRKEPVGSKDLSTDKTEVIPLFDALRARAHQLGYSVEEMCAALNYSYSYFNQIRGGRRFLKATSKDFTKACAKFLGVPHLTVLMMADIVSLNDFYTKSQDVTKQLPEVIKQVIKDPEWSGLADSEVLASPLKTKYFIVKLYEKGQERVFFQLTLHQKKSFIT